MFEKMTELMGTMPNTPEWLVKKFGLTEASKYYASLIVLIKTIQTEEEMQRLLLVQFQLGYFYRDQEVQHLANMN